MKVEWVCQFSNVQVREKLHFSKSVIDNLIHLLLYKVIQNTFIVKVKTKCGDIHKMFWE